MNFQVGKLLPLIGDKLKIAAIATKKYLFDNVMQGSKNWRFAQLRDTSDLASDQLSTNDVQKANAALVKGSLLYDSPEHALSIMNESKQFGISAIEAIKSKDSNLYDGELEHFEKMIVQRRVSPFWFANTGYPNDDLVIPDRWLVILNAFIGTLIKAAKTDLGDKIHDPLFWMMQGRDPQDSVEGWPTFSGIPAIRLTAAGLFQSPYPYTRSSLEGSCQDISDALDLEDMGPFPIAVGKRSGAKIRAQPEWVLKGDHLEAHFETSAIRADGRTINMASSFGNNFAEAAVGPVKYGLFKFKNFHHTLENLKETNKYFIHGCFESDMSKYDNSIHISLRLAVWRFIAKWLKNDDLYDIMAMFETERNVLHPTPYGEGKVNVITKRTGLLSGDKWTSVMGSILSFVTICYAYEIMGKAKLMIDSDGTLNPSCFPNVRVQSDDILNPGKFTDAEAAKYTAIFLTLGFTVKTAHSSRFLMKHVYPIREYMIFARIIQQTLSNEHDVTHPGQMALGFASRIYSGVHPLLESAFHSWHDDILVKKTNFKIIGSPPAKDIKTLVSHYVNHPSVQLFLKSAAGLQWYEQLVLEADFKPASYDMLSLLKDARIAPEIKDSSKFRVELIKRLFSTNRSIFSQAVSAIKQLFTF